MDLQETALFKNKIENLLSRIAVLEGGFGIPTDDVAEQGRRNELIRYAIISPFRPMLSSFQQVRGHRRTATMFIREARAAATHWSRSKRRRGFCVT